MQVQMSEEPADAERPTGGGTAILAAVALLGFIAIYVEAGDFGRDARIFPRLIAVVGGLSSLVVMANAIKRLLAERAAPAATPGIARGGVQWIDFVISYVSPVLYALILYLLGFWIASVLCMIGLMVIMGERRWFLMITLTAGTLLTIYGVFTLGFAVRLPQGILFQ